MHEAVLPYLEHLFEEDISVIAPELICHAQTWKLFFVSGWVGFSTPVWSRLLQGLAPHRKSLVSASCRRSPVSSLKEAHRPSGWRLPAALLRFLTPYGEQRQDGAYRGRLDLPKVVGTSGNESSHRSTRGQALTLVSYI